MQAASITAGFISDSNQHRRHEGERVEEKDLKKIFIASPKWTRDEKLERKNRKLLLFNRNFSLPNIAVYDFEMENG